MTFLRNHEVSPHLQKLSENYSSRPVGFGARGQDETKPKPKRASNQPNVFMYVNKRQQPYGLIGRQKLQ